MSAMPTFLPVYGPNEDPAVSLSLSLRAHELFVLLQQHQELVNNVHRLLLASVC